MMRSLLMLITLLTGVACGSPDEASAAGDVSQQTPANGARTARQAIESNDTLSDAQRAIELGHPWRATQIIAPLLRNPQTRTPTAIHTAARAAAGWGGWSEVDRLLAKETWIDAQFEGQARELLTRSAFERGADTLALSHARLALRDATSPELRASRLVLLARALERNNMFDSAAAAYARAADSFLPIRDWLILRAAGSESDSTKRAETLARATLPVVRARVAWTDAQARERFGDALGAATRYASVGATVMALRLRLSVAPDSATRNTAKDELLAFIRAHPGSSDARTAVEVLDKAFTTLSPGEQLTIARGIAPSGAPARAIAAFERASAEPALIAASDRLLYAQVLARAGRTREASAQLDAVEGPLAGQAAYQRARMLMTVGTADATRSALRSIMSKFASDTAPASASMYLLADLLTDTGDDTGARTVYEQLYRTYPTSSYAASARFRAAMLDFVSDNAGGAARRLDSLGVIAPRSDDATAAKYWSGRAWAQAGNDSLARARWSAVITQQPTSYYAVVAARRLGQKPWTPPARADSFPANPQVDSAFARAALLERLGMDVEARFEYDALEVTASGSPDRMLATANAFLLHGQPSRAMRLGQKLVDAGLRDARSYRLLFPVIDRDELTRDAKARGLDPALVAGLIRQESSFNPRAVSIAGARGLMQLMPDVGAEIARALNYPVWQSVLLFDPDANLQLGTAHLASFSKQYGALPRVLAAYNAGGSRVGRWSTKAGVDDAEVFIERIPFVETRDYVRLVQRNAEFYRLLYGW